MTCYDVRGKLSAVLDGAAGPDVRAAVAAHVETCADCKAELSALAGTDRLIKRAVQTAETAAPPPGYFEEFATRLDRQLAGLAGREEAMSMSTSKDRGTGGTPPGDPAPREKQEISGLHDIRQLARSTMERKAEQAPDEDALLSAVSSSSLAKVVLPTPGREQEPVAVAAAPSRAFAAERYPAKKKSAAPWVAATILVAAAAGFAFIYKDDLLRMAGMSKQEETVASAEQAQPTAAATPTSDNSGAAAPGGVAQAPAVEAMPATPPPPPVNPAPVAEDDHADREHKPKDTKEKPEKGDHEKSPAKPAVAEKTDEEGGETAKTPVVAAPKKEKEGLDSLLDEAAGPAAPPDVKKDTPPAEKPPEEANLPQSLTPADIRSGMGKVKALVQGCYDKYKVGGTIQIKVRIDRDGTVASADAVDDKFAATETGLCVASAVKKATFTKFSGPPMTFNYPFRLQ